MSHPVGLPEIYSGSPMADVNSQLDLGSIEQALAKSAFGVSRPNEAFDRRLVHAIYSAWAGQAGQMSWHG
ncbi:MAG TPA: hypothetical protein VNU24_06330 [Solirubrobacteraceae bacterium]|nr:hypothetical protein [Solirubrobacteraceae bacterium]